MLKNKEYSIKSIFSDLRNNRLSRKAKDLVGGWLLSGDSKEEKEAELRGLFDDMFDYNFEPGQDAYRMLADLKRRQRKQSAEPAVPLRRKRTFLKVAAALALAICISGSVLLLIERKGDTAESDRNTLLTVSAPAAVLITIEAAEQKTVTLPDGSTVSIEPGSKVTYAEDFDTDREVILDGEAFFTVTHDGDRPFMVISNSITVTVYGTEFSVRAFSDDNIAEVELTSGSVAINGEGIDETFMTPGQRFVFDRTHRTITLEQIGEGELLRLRRLNLSLDMQTLDETFGMMSQYFGVKIKVSTELDLTERVGINFDDEVTLEEALSLLQAIISTPFDYEITSDTVKITQRR